ncbi:MAG: carboxypeptidase-like regulatory domain-containing protein [Bryobacteraceae bacterium]
MRLTLRWARLLLVCLSVLMIVTVFYPAIINAQEVSASINGTVTDPNGLGVPAAIIRAQNEATGTSVTTTTSNTGDYVLPSLAAGTYNVTAERPGFRTAVLSNVTLVVFQKARIDIHLEVGEVTAKIEVQASAPLVDSTTATVAGTVENRKIEELPLNLRRFGQLATLFPGAVQDNGGFASSAIGSPFSEATYSANGLRTASNNYLVDGIDMKSLTFGGFSLSPSVDSVQEFKVQTTVFSAAFGRMAGSTINLVTKSGTNEFHGSVFEFLRNDKLDSNNFFNNRNSVSKPEYRRSQFGGAAGGKIIANKTFWYVSYEGLAQRKGLATSGAVPTPAMLSGDFSELLSRGITIIDPLSCPDPPHGPTCQAFSGNIIPADRISLVSKHVISLNPWPAPNVNRSPLDGPNWAATPKDARDDHQFSIKIDQTFSTKDQLFVRYLFGQSTDDTPTSGYTSIPSFGDTLRYRGQNAAVSWIHTFGPRLLNEARISFSRNNNVQNCAQCPRQAGFMEDFGIQGLHALSPQDEGFPYFGILGFLGVGDSNYRPVVSNDMVEKYNDNLTIIRGRHTVVVGVDMQPYQVLGTEAPFSPHGQFGFDDRFTTYPVADFLLGYPGSDAARSLASTKSYQLGTFMNAYAQDDWRVSNTLSINVGLRWEYHRMPVDKRDTMADFLPLPGKPLFTPGNGIILVSGKNADQACNNPLNPADKGLIACADQRSALGFTGRAARSLVLPDRFNWAPRFGIAWRPTASDRLVIRTGYGIFFDLGNFNNLHFVFNNPIFAPNQRAFQPTGQEPAFDLTNVFVAGGTTPALRDTYMSLGVSPFFKQPYVHEWTFNIQSQLTSDMSIEVGYVGNSGIKLGNLHLYANQPRPGLGDLQPRRPWPDFGPMLFTSSDANSSYNSFQFRLAKRMASGLSVQVGYTFAKGIDTNEGDEGFGGGIGNTAPQDDNNLHADRGRSYTDARQRAVFSYIYELPFGKGRALLNTGGITNTIFGGWQLSGVTFFQSGFPFSVLTGRDIAGTGTLNERPDRICNGSLPSGQRTVDHWFDTSCFTTAFMEAAQAAGQPRFGNSGRNILDEPGWQNWDINLYKDTSIKERLRTEIRLEMYNAFNHPHFQRPNSTVGVSGYGQITSQPDIGSGAPRSIQLGLKFLW